MIEEHVHMQGDKDRDNTKAGELKNGVLLMLPFCYLRQTLQRK
jgi:hypothetical protein